MRRRFLGDLDPSLLPEQVQVLLEEFGPERGIGIARILAGTKFTLPRFATTLPPDIKAVLEPLSLDEQRRLAMLFAGDALAIPKNFQADAARDFVERNYDGGNANSLAAEVGMCVRSIHKWVNERPARRGKIGFDPRQARLF